MSAKRPVTFEDVETNVLFMMSLSMDLILRDIDRKIRGEADPSLCGQVKRGGSNGINL